MLNFYLMDENNGNEFRIDGLKCNFSEFMEWTDRSNFIDKMEEEYGVLDAFALDDDEQAFSSYEIEEEDFPILLEKFRKEFVKNKWI